jgi:hypothetical protein
VRSQQQHCLVCGKAGHQARFCKSSRSGQSSINRESPKDNARPGQ